MHKHDDQHTSRELTRPGSFMLDDVRDETARHGVMPEVSVRPSGELGSQILSQNNPDLKCYLYVQGQGRS